MILLALLNNAPGREAVVATNNDSAYLIARELREAGVKVVALVDSRESSPNALLQGMRGLGIPPGECAGLIVCSWSASRVAAPRHSLLEVTCVCTAAAKRRMVGSLPPAFSSTDGKPVTMAMLRAGRSQPDKIVTVHDGGRVVTQARVVAPVFYDPSGARMYA